MAQMNEVNEMAGQPPTIRTRAKPACPLCGTAGKLLHAGLTDRLFSAPGVWQLKQCPRAECGLVWPDPAPLEEDLGLAYQMYYTHPEPAKGLAGVGYCGCGRACLKADSIPAGSSGLRKGRR